MPRRHFGISIRSSEALGTLVLRGPLFFDYVERSIPPNCRAGKCNALLGIEGVGATFEILPGESYEPLRDYDNVDYDNVVSLSFQDSLEVSPDDARIAELINLVQAHPRCAVCSVDLEFLFPGNPEPGFALPGLAEALLGCSNTLGSITSSAENHLLPLLEAQHDINYLVLNARTNRPLIPLMTPCMEQIFAALGQPRPLTEISIHGVPLSCTNLVAEMIRNPPSLRTVEIGFCGEVYGESHLVPVFQALQDNTSVQKLSFQRNLLGSDPQISLLVPVLSGTEAKALVAVLEEQFTLTCFTILITPTGANEAEPASLDNWPKIKFYLFLNIAGRAQIWSTKLTAHNEWKELAKENFIDRARLIHHCFWYKDGQLDYGRIVSGQVEYTETGHQLVLSNIFYYLKEKGISLSIFDLDRFGLTD